MAVTVQSILRKHFDAFDATHPLADYQRRAAWRMRACRTAAMGGHIVSCPNGHVHTLHFNSCRHRSCPQCASLQRETWLAGWEQRLLPCSYGHVVFTVPQELVPLWRYNKRAFGDVLFRAAIETLRELLGDEKYLGALPGMLAALHTWSQTLFLHPHVHVLLTWGGLTDDGRWVEPKKSCLLPRAVPMEVFRGKIHAYLLKALDAGNLVLPPGTTDTRLRNLLNKLGRVTWDVKVLGPYRHGQGVLAYLARYLKGGPISNGRLLDLSDGVVSFRYRQNCKGHHGKSRGVLKTLALDVDTFLARLLEHVPPPSYQTVRGYGLYASCKQAALAVARARFGQTPQPERTSVTWRDLCERAGHRDAAVCPVCGAALVVSIRFPAGQLPPTLMPFVPIPGSFAQPPPAKAG